MRRYYTVILLLMLLVMPVTGKTKQLMILHTNDTHSCIMPLNTHLADTMLAGRGGFIRRATMIKEQRKQYPNLLLIDSGAHLTTPCSRVMWRLDL